MPEKQAFGRILLASHGTEGAMAAENKAVSTCTQGGTIDHLIVVPTLWQGMTGDDWLNNGNTRDKFCRYLETELGREVDEHIQRVHQQAQAHALGYNKIITFGEPDESLLYYSKKTLFDLVIIGSPRPPGKKGLRSRMLTQDLIRSLAIPLLIVPYPSPIAHE
ncbi:Nucleotide-binding universal stress protein, UspA family [Nitrosomonas cryotolerans]|uniref:Nucleotide-binding universal stress protein, UspA family n=1 Tax=Nitrosomonas cryotolerans ATCC 49181 TaxID=1131553 RepID=A0A1N6F6H7_9PROT|nr:universal stress protein [Nitrosomonas cryotolerans]SFP98696.1 Nucleotide-binding universal stress protein, UspA family [Nitrosomonas cryotolerans]SIN90871.1 Nucleotide-binding universal stress protein, UspA family [Nitrosomonas cryotolerans ATCC 49181]